MAAVQTQVHTSKKFRLGTRFTSAAGNEYIYLKGVTNCVLGSWVSFDEVHVTTLLIANALGRVAIAQAAVNASTSFGWFQIYGIASGLCLASYADNAKVWATATAGSVDDADVAVDLIGGAVGRSARNTTTGLATFELNRPFAINEVQN